MGVYEYRGDPGLGYLRLACAHGTAPVTDLKPGDLVDFGGNEPPDGRWIEAAEGTEATRLPDNHPDNRAVVEWPEDEPIQDAAPAPAEPSDEAPPSETSATDTPPAAAPTKRAKSPAKTTA